MIYTYHLYTLIYPFRCNVIHAMLGCTPEVLVLNTILEADLSVAWSAPMR